jgi:amino acid adenylation domain-containing protein
MVEIEFSIPILFEARVQEMPENLALIDSSSSYTYQQLNSFANQIANSLLEKAPSRSETVCLLFEHGIASIAAMLGVLKAGLIYVPIDSRNPADQISFYLSDSHSSLLVCDRRTKALAEKFTAPGWSLVNLDELGGQPEETNPRKKPTPDTLAALYYTSGSTGKPKGIIKDHRSICHLRHRPLPVGSLDRETHLLSFSFAASISNIFGALFNGACIDCYDLNQKGLVDFPAWMKMERINIFSPTVSVFRQFTNMLDKEALFPDLRVVRLFGEQVYARDLTNFWQHVSESCKIDFFLASSEAGVIAHHILDRKKTYSYEAIPVGYANKDTRIMILDEQGHTLGYNQLGEIAVGTCYGSVGYWQNPELTRQKMLSRSGDGDEKIYLTGDIGKLRRDGLLEHHGRKDFMVKVRGYRVELPSVELALRNLAGVKEAVVVGKADKAQETRLAAYIVPESWPGPRPERLRKLLLKQYPEYMVPVSFTILRDLPHTVTGKIDRNALPEPSHNRDDMVFPYQPPRDPLEGQLAEIWAQVLGLDKVGIEDNFFDLGGDSLQAMRLFVQIERIIGKKLPLSLLLKASTVAQQANLLHSENIFTDWSALVPVQIEGQLPPLFCFPGVGGNVLTFHDFSRHLGKNQPCYALQSRGLGGNQKPLAHIEDIAAAHLVDIQGVQAHGPYYLCGSSFGGMVAYEVAQQLHDKGEQVALVALFDTYGHGYPKRKAGVSRSNRRLHRYMGDFKKHYQNLLSVNWRTRLDYLGYRVPGMFKRLKSNYANLYQQVRYPLPKDLREVRKANKRATRYHYLPPRFGGHLVLFRASQQPYGVNPDPLLGWGSIAGEHLEVIEVTGEHDILLWEPQVGTVAKRFQSCLATIQLEFSEEKA